MPLRIAPITITAARAFTEAHHAHLHAPVSGLCAVSVEHQRGEGWALACVAILSRPVSRELQAQGCAEVVRVSSDGTPHAASMCLAAITRAALALGWRRIVSSTLLGEAGTTYRAAGWRPVALSGGGEWGRDGRDRDAAVQPGAKVRWETGPDALPLAADVDAIVRASVGKVDLRERMDTLPLFAGL